MKVRNFALIILAMMTLATCNPPSPDRPKNRGSGKRVVGLLATRPLRSFRPCR